MIYLQMFLAFFRIGVFGFGGGLAMLPLIFQTVRDFGYMSDGDFSNLVALSQVTPGPVAVNAATFVGFNFGGMTGALSATLGVSIPSFVLMLLVARFMTRYSGAGALEAAFTGIRPATVGLIAAAAVFVGQASLVTEGTGALLDRVDPMACGIFAVTFILINKFKVSPIPLIIAAAVFGAVFYN